MSAMTVRLLDAAKKTVATARVSPEGDGYIGEIDLALMPADLRSLFEEYEYTTPDGVYQRVPVDQWVYRKELVQALAREAAP